MAKEHISLVETNLAFRPSLTKDHFNELIGSGISLQEAYNLTWQLTRCELSYYFLEYFAKRKLVNFGYHFEADGRMTANHYQRFGDVCELFERAIDERERMGQSSDRERAELEGLLKIKQTLIAATEKVSVLLVSPPPPISEARSGYSDYCFVYFGLYDPETKTCEMFAWRNNLSLEAQRSLVNGYNNENVISPVPHPNDFLGNPVFKFGQKAVDEHRKLLEKAPAPCDFLEGRQIVDKAAKMLTDLIYQACDNQFLNLAVADIEMEFIKLIEQKDKEPMIFDSKFLKIRDGSEAYQYVLGKQAVLSRQFNLAVYQSGSCSGSMLSTLKSSAGNRMLSILTASILPDIVGSLGSEASFECPNCHGQIPSGLGITTCPHCSYTKEQAAIDSGASCG